MTGPTINLPWKRMPATAAAFALVTLACQPHSPAGDDSAILETTKCIGADGGRLDVLGATLEVPSDALLHEVCVTLRHEAVGPPGFLSLGPVVSISADRPAQLERPFTLSVAFTGELGTSHPVRQDGAEWVRVGDSTFEQVVMSNGRARIQSYEAGSIAVVEIADAECLTDLDCDVDSACDEFFECFLAFCEEEEDCEDGFGCFEEECVPGCVVDADCADFGVVCGFEGLCEFIECEFDDECPLDQHCAFEFLAEGAGEGICIPEDWGDEEESGEFDEEEDELDDKVTVP